MTANAPGVDELIGLLAGEYAPVFERAREVFERDERVDGLYLSGSLGRGDCDEWSDLDLTILSSSGYHAFVADSHLWVSLISEPVWSSRTTGRDSFLASWIDSEWRRFDVLVRRMAGNSGVSASLRLVFDRVDRPVAVESGVDTAPPGPRLRNLSDEFLRVLGLLVPMLRRGELEAAVTGFHLLRSALIELFTLANGGTPIGVKRLRSTLTPQQINALQTLPDPGSSAESIRTAYMAVAAAFLPLARDLAPQWNFDWPAEFEAATSAYLIRGLKLELP